jgi:hypothetical protein
MKRRNIIAIVILLVLPFFAVAQEKEKNRIRFNVGMKAGFQAVTYNDPEFEIEGYEFDTNNIQSNKIGYAISPFARMTFGKFYLQTEATFGITNHSFDFHDVQLPEDAIFKPNNIIYNLTTYCMQVPILVGYNFIQQDGCGLGVFTGPRTKFVFTSMSDQQFEHFKYEDLEEVLKDKTYYWEIGLGIKIYRVFLDLTYDIGLTKASSHIISKSAGKTFTSNRRDNVLSFSVGFIF